MKCVPTEDLCQFQFMAFTSAHYAPTIYNYTELYAHSILQLVSARRRARCNKACFSLTTRLIIRQPSFVTVNIWRIKLSKAIITELTAHYSIRHFILPPNS